MFYFKKTKAIFKISTAVIKTSCFLKFYGHRIFDRLRRKSHFTSSNHRRFVCAAYAMQYEHKGLRSITGYGISITRGAAAGMSFTFSLLLLTMCRNIITKLRETVFNLYIPFDSHVEFHKVVAYTALVFTSKSSVSLAFLSNSNLTNN